MGDRIRVALQMGAETEYIDIGPHDSIREAAHQFCAKYGIAVALEEEIVKEFQRQLQIQIRQADGHYFETNESAPPSQSKRKEREADDLHRSGNQQSERSRPLYEPDINELRQKFEQPFENFPAQVTRADPPSLQQDRLKDSQGDTKWTSMQNSNQAALSQPDSPGTKLKKALRSSNHSKRAALEAAEAEKQAQNAKNPVLKVLPPAEQKANETKKAYNNPFEHLLNRDLSHITESEESYTKQSAANQVAANNNVVERELKYEEESDDADELKEIFENSGYFKNKKGKKKAAKASNTPCSSNHLMLPPTLLSNEKVSNLSLSFSNKSPEKATSIDDEPDIQQKEGKRHQVGRSKSQPRKPESQGLANFQKATTPQEGHRTNIFYASKEADIRESAGDFAMQRAVDYNYQVRRDCCKEDSTAAREKTEEQE